MLPMKKVYVETKQCRDWKRCLLLLQEFAILHDYNRALGIQRVSYRMRSTVRREECGMKRYHLGIYR
jgi:hypothetical protein